LRKNFFFEKKKQKTFDPLRAGRPGDGATPPEGNKSFFGYFFFKKSNFLLAFLLWE